MSYNKARAERKWLKWKETEEKQLRELGVDEEIIQRLHVYDWEVFKSDRRFYERISALESYIYSDKRSELEEEVCSVEDLLNSIENEHLLTMLRKSDQTAIYAAMMKDQGFTVREIADELEVTPAAVYAKIERLIAKLKQEK